MLADDKGHVRGLALKNKNTGAASELAVKGVFVAIGHLPNTQPFAGSLPLDSLGYFVPESGSQVKTKVSGVFVAGDCADHVYRQAVTVWRGWAARPPLRRSAGWRRKKAH